MRDGQRALVAASLAAASALAAELLARFAIDAQDARLSALRSTLVILPLFGGVLAALRGGATGAIAGGGLAALYSLSFLVRFSSLPDPSLRLGVGLVVAAAIFSASLLIGVSRDRFHRLSADALAAERRRRAEIEARNRDLALANQALSDFSHVVAHDLRNPVRGIHALAVALEEDLAPKLSEAEREDLALLRRETERLTGLLEALLEYSRVTRFDPDDLTPVRIAEVLASDACRARYEALAREHGARVVPPPEDAPPVRANPGALALVLGNLVANAITHGADSQPEVRVEVRDAPSPGQLEVVVEDNGAGFSQRSLERVRDALEGREPLRGLGRSGFGLVLVSRAVERMRGELSLGRSSLGGAAVAVRLARI